MENILTWTAVLLSGISVLLLLIVIKNIKSNSKAVTDAVVHDEFRETRKENAEDARRLREEVSGTQKAANEIVVKAIAEMGRLQQDGMDAVEKRVKTLVDSNESRLDKLRETIETQMKSIQSGNETKIEHMQNSVTKTIGEMKKSQQEDLHLVEKRVKLLTESNETRLDKLRDSLDNNMKSLQDNNEKKLDQMRQTVDEKLQSTLEKRLGESFKLVSERLEAVQRGLGDMQNLATGVGDLKRMLTNVKTRGTWGEFQIADILEQLLTPEQYEKNVQPKKGSSDTVEYAIRLPGQSDSSEIWLPIDSKFPQEDYQRLISAAENADAAAVEKSTAALIRAIQNSAKDIADKYVDPPHTTDFAIMFLPTEGLYSEVLRQPGMVEKLQQQYRVVVAGPTTLSAILNSLRMGFRTLAIEKRSSEVWTVLSAVKTEFGKFGEVLSKVKKQLDTASNTIEQTGVRTRAMERKLRDVEKLPVDESSELLGLEDANYIANDDEEESKTS
ncbi:MAG TPA: DNA recombination protein RmuC [Gammaproteobacteria bacterium]|nr:DNA recombination protein RmuC [Gammaproteobacteria bacterium]